MMMMMMMMTAGSTLSPVKVDSGHLVEFNVKRSIELSQSVQHGVVYRRMCSSFRLAETSRRRVVFYVVELLLLQGVPAVMPPSLPLSTASPVAETREALGRVEVEVAVVHDPRKPEEVLEERHLAGRVRDQSLAADEVESFERKVTQPPGQMTRVQTDLHCSPRSVDRPSRSLNRAVTSGWHERKLVERSLEIRPLRHGLIQ